MGHFIWEGFCPRCNIQKKLAAVSKNSNKDKNQNPSERLKKSFRYFVLKQSSHEAFTVFHILTFQNGCHLLSFKIAKK